jgi:hypothetical protein
MPAIHYQVGAAVAALTLAFFVANQPSAVYAQDGAAPTPLALEPRTIQAGPVTIKVEPRLFDTALAFKVTLDSHSVDLDRYDLGQLALARTDEGLEVQPEAWEAPKGGHHREGTLAFPRISADGRELIGPNTRGLELVIRDIGGVQTTVIQWTTAA